MGYGLDGHGNAAGHEESGDGFGKGMNSFT